MSKIDVRKEHELIIQSLFALLWDDKQDKNNLIKIISDQNKVSKSHFKKIWKQTISIYDKQDVCFRIISEHIKNNKSLVNLSKLEQSVCIWAIYEFIFSKSMKKEIVMAEAMRLCNKFSLKEYYNWVNPFLESVYESL